MIYQNIVNYSKYVHAIIATSLFSEHVATHCYSYIGRKFFFTNIIVLQFSVLDCSEHTELHLKEFDKFVIKRCFGVKQRSIAICFVCLRNVKEHSKSTTVINDHGSKLFIKKRIDLLC